MKKIVVVFLSAVLLGGTAMAQQTNNAAPKSETMKAAKHKKKKTKLENGTVDAQRQAGQVTAQPVNKPGLGKMTPEQAKPATKPAQAAAY